MTEEITVEAEATELKARIKELQKKHPVITQRKLAEELGISSGKVNTLLKDMKSQS